MAIWVIAEKRLYGRNNFIFSTQISNEINWASTIHPLFLIQSLPGPSLEEVPLERRAVIWFLLAVVCATPTCTLAKIHGRQ